MRQYRLLQLVGALLGALASLIVIIDYLDDRGSQPLPERPAPAPSATAIPAPEVVPPLPTPAREPDSEVSQIVYRTPSGERYHRVTCGYVKGKGIPLSLAEAKEQGLTPCRVCNPPSLP